MLYYAVYDCIKRHYCIDLKNRKVKRLGLDWWRGWDGVSGEGGCIMTAKELFSLSRESLVCCVSLVCRLSPHMEPAEVCVSAAHLA